MFIDMIISNKSSQNIFFSQTESLLTAFVARGQWNPSGSSFPSNVFLCSSCICVCFLSKMNNSRRNTFCMLHYKNYTYDCTKQWIVTSHKIINSTAQNRSMTNSNSIFIDNNCHKILKFYWKDFILQILSKNDIVFLLLSF